MANTARSMREKVQALFVKTPKEKQVMMFSATLTEETSRTCSLFMLDPLLITLVGNEEKLLLRGLTQVRIHNQIIANVAYSLEIVLL